MGILMLYLVDHFFGRCTLRLLDQPDLSVVCIVAASYAFFPSIHHVIVKSTLSEHLHCERNKCAKFQGSMLYSFIDLVMSY